MESLNSTFGALGGVGLIVGIIAYTAKTIVNLVTTRNQRRLDNFDHYASKYSEILSATLRNGPFERKFSSKSPDDRELALRLFMLFSEELYLAEDRELIDEKVWDIWRSGIEFVMSHAFFQGAWTYCRRQVDFEGDFAELIDSAIQKKSEIQREIRLRLERAA